MVAVTSVQTAATRETTEDNKIDFSTGLGLQDNGWLKSIGDSFDKGARQKNRDMETAHEKLASNTSNAAYLADYQKALSEYNLYRTAQSSSVSVIKQTDSGIIQNWRG